MNIHGGDKEMARKVGREKVALKASGRWVRGIFVAFFCSCSSANLQIWSMPPTQTCESKAFCCVCLTEIESCVLTYLPIPYSHRERGKHVTLLCVDPSTWIATLHKLLTLQCSLFSLIVFTSHIPITGQ